MALSEQVKRFTDQKSERRWEMVETKYPQQLEMEGKLQRSTKNHEQLWAQFLLKPVDDNGHNLMPRKFNVFYALVYVICIWPCTCYSSSKIVAKLLLIHHLHPLPGKV